MYVGSSNFEHRLGFVNLSMTVSLLGHFHLFQFLSKVVLYFQFHIIHFMHLQSCLMRAGGQILWKKAESNHQRIADV